MTPNTTPDGYTAVDSYYEPSLRRSGVDVQIRALGRVVLVYTPAWAAALVMNAPGAWAANVISWLKENDDERHAVQACAMHDLRRASYFASELYYEARTT